MLSYKITDDEIKWKKEPASEATQANASTPIIGEEWCEHDFDVEKKTKAALMCNIANALKVCHSKYEKLKKLNNQQKHEHESYNWECGWSCKCSAMTQGQQMIKVFKRPWKS
jgi:hypothetical protein